MHNELLYDTDMKWFIAQAKKKSHQLEKYLDLLDKGKNFDELDDNDKHLIKKIIESSLSLFKFLDNVDANNEILSCAISYFTPDEIINIRHSQDNFIIILKGHLPKRNVGKIDNSYRDFIGEAISKYKENHSWKTLKKASVTYTHVYKKDTPSSKIRDNDNYHTSSCKQILDALVDTCIIHDDQGLNVPITHKTCIGIFDSTIISVNKLN